MSQGDLARLGVRTTAHQSRIGYGVMGRTEGPTDQQWLFRRQHPHHRVYLGHLKRLLPGHVRQDRRQPLAEHALAGARWADHQHVMASGSRHLQRPLHVLLTHHVLEIQTRDHPAIRHPGRFLLQLDLTIQTGGQLTNIPDRYDRRSSGQCRLCSVLFRDEQILDPIPLGSQRHGQHTGDRADLSVQTHLAKERTAGLRSADPTASGHDAEQYGQIVMGPRLFHIGGSQIHGDPASREM